MAVASSSALRARPLTLCRRGATVACRSAGRPRERGLDEGIDVAAEHTGGVADLEPGSVVLHERVRVQEVRADLAAPVGRTELAALFGLRFLLLAHAALQETRAKDLHRGLFVLQLGAFVLTGDDDA